MSNRKEKLTAAERDALNSIVYHNGAFVHQRTWDRLIKKGCVELCPVHGSFLLTGKGRQAAASGYISD